MCLNAKAALRILQILSPFAVGAINRWAANIRLINGVHSFVHRPSPFLSPLSGLLSSLLGGRPLCVFSAVLVEMVKATRKQQRRQQKKQEGGKRKSTRKLGKKASEWHKLVMDTYREMKKKNSDTRLMDAMKEAKKRKGQLKH